MIFINNFKYKEYQTNRNIFKFNVRLYMGTLSTSKFQISTLSLYRDERKMYYILLLFNVSEVIFVLAYMRFVLIIVNK